MTTSSTAAQTVRPGLPAPRPTILTSLTDQRVLSIVGRGGGAVSRAEIADLAELSRPAVSSSAARLVERGVIHEVGTREGKRGGVATLFEINPDHGWSIAVTIESKAVSVRARDLTGAVRSELSTAIAVDESAEQVVAAANALIGQAKRGVSAPFFGATVSIADPYNQVAGRPVVLDRSVFPAATFSPDRDLDLGGAAHVVVDNDVNWAALGEHRTGSLRGCDHFVYVYAGEGLGAGLLLDGKLFRGSRGLAGEIGYLITSGDIQDPLDLTQRLVSQGLGTPGRYALDLAKASALFSSSTLPETALAIVETVAVAVANLSIVLNPSAIALGGPLTRFAPFTAELTRRVEALAIDPPAFVLSDSTPMAGASFEAHSMALREAGFPDQSGPVLR